MNIKQQNKLMLLLLLTTGFGLPEKEDAASAGCDNNCRFS
jgi:hypothetical protein